jgi:hypothetical protein
MGIGQWASVRRKQIWLARFGVEIAKCNTDPILLVALSIIPVELTELSLD